MISCVNRRRRDVTNGTGEEGDGETNDERPRAHLVAIWENKEKDFGGNWASHRLTSISLF